MPGVEVGTAFVGAMAISAYSGSETISEADLWLKAGDQIVTARSIGEDPLASFANYTALGPMFSPTIQNAYIENVFFSLTGGGAYGSIGIWVVGQDPVFGMHFDHAIGSIDSLTAAPEPMTGTLTLLGLGMLAIRRISDKRAHLLRSSIRPEV
jgi:hypothetical protein